MKLAVSNIGWDGNLDETVYSFLQGSGFQGLEIAPTRIFPDNPYVHISEARFFSDLLKRKYGLSIVSMQSIWFGKTENLFRSFAERQILLDYTKAAIRFAAAMSCKNLVFGCPRNRNIEEDRVPVDTVQDFFYEVGTYAASRGTVLSIEANPVIYHTNYINDTQSAITLAKEINSAGIAVNLDVGAMIANGEAVDILKGNEALLHHVHISEPYLKEIRHRTIHAELAELLRAGEYDGYISIEMGKQDTIDNLQTAMRYVMGVFGK